MISGPEALAGHRILCTPQVVDTPMPKLAWDAGPQRVTDAVATVLRHHVETGELEIDDVHRAASQFLCLARASCMRGWCSGATSTRPLTRWKRNWRPRLMSSCAPMLPAGRRDDVRPPDLWHSVLVCYHSDAVPAGLL
jgi:hypothetical protein